MYIAKKIAASRRLHLPRRRFFVTETRNQGYIFAENSTDMSRIHNSKIFELVQVHKRFSVAWVAQDGHIVRVDQAELTNKNEEDSDKPKDGMYSKGRRFNIVCIPSGEIRTVNIDFIIEFNGEEVFL